MENLKTPHSTLSSKLERQSLTTSTSAEPGKDQMVTALLMKLSVHYYRPDFTEGQARSLIKDFLEDLAEFRVAEIENAILAYRRNAENQFFPKPAQLRELIYADRKEERERTRYAGKAPLTRPLQWWLQPRALWRPDWRDSEIPKGER